LIPAASLEKNASLWVPGVSVSVVFNSLVLP
jgi:hypothetical protein